MTKRLQPSAIDGETQSFFSIMQEKDYKTRLNQLMELQAICKTEAIRKRLPAEIARARRFAMWGKVAERCPTPPPAA